MGCEMSWGMLLLGLGVSPKSQQGPWPFHPLPSPSAGEVVVGGSGGASSARGSCWHCATAPAPLQGTGTGGAARDRDHTEPPGLAGLGTAVNKMIYFKGWGKKPCLHLTTHIC